MKQEKERCTLALNNAKKEDRHLKLLYLSSIVQDILKRKIVQILKVQKLTYGHAKCKSDSMEGTYSGVECLAIYQIVKSGLANSAHF